jgi:tetraacyldisaccharide-1-P 4'-kinase
VRIWAYSTPRAGHGFVVPRGCVRTVPKTATAVHVVFFDDKSKYPIGLEPWREPRSSRMGSRTYRPDELSQFTVTC